VRDITTTNERITGILAGDRQCYACAVVGCAFTVLSATDSRRALIGTIAIHFDTLILSITNEMFTGAASQERIAGIFSVTRNSDTSRIVGITFRVLFASDGDGTLIGPLTSYGHFLPHGYRPHPDRQGAHQCRNPDPVHTHEGRDRAISDR
jgi:hypothetical protein